MHVALLVDSIDTQQAGVAIYAQELIKALLERAPSSMRFTVIHVKENEFFEGLPHAILGYPNLPLGSQTWRMLHTLPKLLRELNVDVVHDTFHMAPFLQTHASYKRVVTIHDLTPILFPEHHVWRGPLLHKLLLPRILRNADAIICPSESTKQDVLEFEQHIQEPSVIPLAPRNLGTPKSMPVEKPFILFVGTLEPRKRVTMLLEAFEALDMNIDLVLAGEMGWKSSSIQKAIQSSSKKDQIHLLGRVSDSELAWLYQNTRGVVYPSIYEGFGLPPLEAMAYGAPVIVSKNSSLIEVGGEAAMYLDGGAGDLKNMLKKLLNSPEEEKLRATLGKKHAASFSWKRTAEQTIEVYQTLRSI